MPGTRLPPRPLTRSAVAFAAAAAALALGACSKFDALPDKPLVAWSPPVVLMHRGGGNDCGPGLPCWPNTLPAVLHGLDTLDGAEVDIQVSADGSIWLGHDNEVVDCAGTQIGCFQDLHNADIAARAYCDGAAPCDPADGSPTCIQHYVTAEDLFSGIADVHPEKKISLDIKGQYCRELGVSEAQHMADEVDRLVRSYGMEWRVLAETSQLAFHDELKSRAAPVYTFVVSLGDVDGPLGAAARQGADGISFKWGAGIDAMDASVVAGIHQKGFRIILWTIDTPEDIAAAWATAPDVIETDEPLFFDYVPAPAQTKPAP